MAILNINSIEHEVPDGSNLHDFCQDAGLDFQCQNGVCGSCVMTVQSGGENLSDPSTEELALGCDGQQRLACQCQILKGRVSVIF